MRCAAAHGLGAGAGTKRSVVPGRPRVVKGVFPSIIPHKNTAFGGVYEPRLPQNLGVKMGLAAHWGLNWLCDKVAKEP